MPAHNGAVDHRVFTARIGSEVLKDPFPHTGFGPSAETPMNVFPVAEALWQVTPGNPSAISVQHRLYEQTVVGCCRTDAVIL
jgi:hypothetical protein